MTPLTLDPRPRRCQALRYFKLYRRLTVAMQEPLPTLEHDTAATINRSTVESRTEGETRHVSAIDQEATTPAAQSRRLRHVDLYAESSSSEDSTLIDKDEKATNSRQERPATLSLLPPPSSVGRQLSSVEDGQPPPQPPLKKPGPVAWRDLPNKRQLFILTMTRLAEPITQTSLQAYMFYQLKSFDPSLPDATIAAQAGILQGCFTGAQCVTAMMWGRIADAEWGGRKRVLLVGLTGTCISAVGFGFSRSFLQAAVFRALGGILNGNVGVIRTMVSEVIKEKKCATNYLFTFQLTGVQIPIESLSSPTDVFQYWSHRRTDPWRCTCRSSAKLPKPVRRKLVLWRQRWGLVDEALAVCLTKSDQRHISF